MRSLSTFSLMTFYLSGHNFSSSTRLVCTWDRHLVYEWLPMEGSLVCLILTKQRYQNWSIESQVVSSFPSLVGDPTWTDFARPSPNGKESSYSTSFPPFSSSLWSSCSVVGTPLAFYTLGTIRKYYRDNYWSLHILSTPFLVGKQTRRCLIDITTSS